MADDESALPPTLPPAESDWKGVYAHLVEMQRSHDKYLNAQALKSYTSVVEATTHILVGKLLVEAFERIDEKSKWPTWVATAAAVAAVIVAGADLIAHLTVGG